MCNTNHQYEYCLAKTICVITWKLGKKNTASSAIFGKIVINGFTDKNFILYCILLWIQFYRLNFVLVALPIPEFKKVTKNYQKQLPLIINVFMISIEKSIIIVYSYHPYSLWLRTVTAFDDTFCCSLAIPLQLPTAATQPVSQSYHFMSLNMHFIIMYIIIMNNVMV